MAVTEGFRDFLCGRLQETGEIRLAAVTPRAEQVLRQCARRIGAPESKIVVSRADGIVTLTIKP